MELVNSLKGLNGQVVMQGLCDARSTVRIYSCVSIQGAYLMHTQRHEKGEGGIRHIKVIVRVGVTRWRRS